VHELVFGAGHNRKPTVAGIEFNLSHTDGLALVAVAGARRVGVDVERIAARAIRR
jgi:phosphopantetheinyl transferase